MMDNAVLKALRERRSIRRYKPEQITDEELQAVLEAGTWAPTGMGRQDPWIVAVQRPELVARLDAMNAAVWGREHPFYGAPTIVLVFGSDPAAWANSTADGSLVLGNMMLAAHEREMFATPEGKALMRELGLPDGLVGIGALALGYPASFPPTVKPRKADYYRIIK